MFNDRVIARFWSLVRKSHGCWLWLGRMDTDGYGKASGAGNGKWIRAHRMAWEINYGDIPEALHVLHKCDNPSCVRPDHLFLGTALDNVADRVEKGRTAHGQTSAYGRRKVCSLGHPFNENNTFFRPEVLNGKSYIRRRCKSCARRYSRTSYYRAKGGALSAAF